MMPPSPRTRTGLRASAAAALASVVMPAAGHWFIRARLRPAVLWAATLNLIAMIVVIVIGMRVHSRADLAALIADRTMVIRLDVALAVLALTRLWASCDAAWQARPDDGTAVKLTAGLAAGLLVLGGVAPLAVAADYVWRTDRAIENVFSAPDAITAYPGAVATDNTMATTRNATPFATPNHMSTTLSATDSTLAATTTTLPPTTTSTLPPIVGENRVNVLLLGGDAGPGRWSLRTDSMIVVSIDPATGDTAMISVSRNVTRLPFPPGTELARRFPRGFDDIANAVYPYVDQHRELAGGGSDAGAQAIKLGIAQLLGMPINYYVLVNMAGFVDVVDALGGIDIDVGARVPSPGNPPGAKHEVPVYIEAGQQRMDGTIALAYARSRSADSDYNRMGRQRCVLAAIATAATPMAVATGLTDLVGAFGDSVRTDIPRERLGEFAQLIDSFSAAGGLSTVRTLHLAPPLVSSTRWNATAVRLLARDAIVPPLPGAAPAPAAPPTKTLAATC